MDSRTCDRCGSAYDAGDKFCRRCGQRFANLPLVRTPNLPVRVNALPPSLVRSVGVLVVGTGIEWLARRFAGSAARAAGRALVGVGDKPASRALTKNQAPEATIDEVLYVRKVQLRR